MFKFFLILVIAAFTADAMKRSFMQRVVATTVAGSLSFLPVTVFAETNMIPTSVVVDKKEKFSIGKFQFIYLLNRCLFKSPFTSNDV